MKDNKKTYVKPEMYVTEVDDVTLCTVSIGIEEEIENKPGRMGARGNYDFEDDEDDTNDF